MKNVKTKIKEFRAEIMERINKIESLVEKQDCSYQHLLIECLKLIDKEFHE